MIEVRENVDLFPFNTFGIHAKTRFLVTIRSIEEAQEGARIIVLNRLAVVKQEIGSLDKVKRIVALNGFVSSAPDFYGHPQVVNGASELLIEIFGEKGKHSRTALGAAALPLNVAVEINLIVEVE